MKKLIDTPSYRAAFIIICILLVPVFSRADFYKWVDEDGIVHMVDSPGQIPSQYRNQVVKKTTVTPTDQEENQSSITKTAVKSSEIPGTNLKHIEIRYKGYEGSSRRIIIPVTFNGSVTEDMLLDTGAPGLLISPKLANRLGLIKGEDENLKIQAGGVGGTVEAMYDIVDTVNVGEARAECLPAVISDFSSFEYEGLVGMEFMANYRISIDNTRNIITFDELPPDQNTPGGHDETWWRSNFDRLSSIRDRWADKIKELEAQDATISAKEKQLTTAKKQLAEADNLYRKLERFARDNAVPSNWRRE